MILEKLKLDAGGLLREWISLLSKEIFSSSNSNLLKFLIYIVDFIFSKLKYY